MTGEHMLEVDGLTMDLKVGREVRRLLNSVSVTIPAGGALGLVGESGSGKSLTARSILRLIPRAATVTGAIRVDGADVLALGASELKALRRHSVAMVHQDPRAAMNPIRTIGDFLTEAMTGVPVDTRMDLARSALAEVGIRDGERRIRQYPHQLSGGLLQRVVIAAALLSDPRLIVADEPTTALDVTTQSAVMAVLSELRERRRLSMLFISHDLDLAAAVTDELAVMYAGAIVEQGPASSMHSRPRHPYTAALMAARPSKDEARRLRTIPGRPIAAYEVASGCVFASRCPFAEPACTEVRPQLRAVDDHTVACHRAEEIHETLIRDWGDAG